MPKFRKKPVVIEAKRWTGTPESMDEIYNWFMEHETVISSFGDRLKIETLEGVMDANVGDWVIRGIRGEFYPCKNDIFEATYEAVEG